MFLSTTLDEGRRPGWDPRDVIPVDGGVNYDAEMDPFTRQKGGYRPTSQPQPRRKPEAR